MRVHMQVREIAVADGMQKRGRSPGEVRRMSNEDGLGRKMREAYEVRSRRGKRRNTRNTEHKRKVCAGSPRRQTKYARSWWSDSIHGHIDNEAFVCPRNGYEREFMRATKVTHHRHRRQFRSMCSSDKKAPVGFQSFLFHRFGAFW